MQNSQHYLCFCLNNFFIVIVFVVWLFDKLGDASVIGNIFKAAGYTYGPLLGLFMFGLITKFKVIDKFVPIICLLSPIYTFFISENAPMLFNYTFGHKLVLLNGIITFIGLLTISTTKQT